MANAEQKATQVDIDKLRIKGAFVDQGPVMKRMEPRSMGRANVIRKRSSHITIVLSEE
jgi:large subunit ribosomal protein L22